MKYLVFLALLSCAPKEPATANITFSMNDSAKRLSEAVTVEMEMAVGERFLHGRHHNFQINVSVADLKEGNLGLAYVPEDFDEDCNIKMAAVMLDTRYYSAADYRLVLMHEIGHCFGLPHTNDPADVMYAYYDSEQASEESIRRFYQQLSAARTGRR